MNYSMESLKEHGVTAPEGFLATGVTCGLKESGRLDLAIIYSEEEKTAAAGVFTKNKFAAAPVQVSKNLLLKSKSKRAVVINSGNANAVAGKTSLDNAWAMVGIASEALDIPKDEILIASTGVIGKQLDMDRIFKGVQQAAKNLTYYGGSVAAEAIMTTDTVAKECMVEVTLKDGGKYKIGGMAKGSGMIAPDMATMIGIITTDAGVKADVFEDLLLAAVNDTFNMVTVDGCQSTNDCVIALANGRSGVSITSDELIDSFKAGLKKVCFELAKMIASDGEGATKLLEIKVIGASSWRDAEMVAKAIANSNLVKTACFGNDPNWGRAIAAIGSCGAEISPELLELYLQDQNIINEGVPVDFDEKKVSKLMDAPNIKWLVKIGNGQHSATVLGCDLSYDYVKINAEYRT